MNFILSLLGLIEGCSVKVKLLVLYMECGGFGVSDMGTLR